MAARTGIGKRREANADASSEFYQERRKAIIDAAAEVFQERGYEAATLAMIAEKLNTDRASLYYYFGAKQELFREIVREAAQKTIEEAEAIAKKDIPAKLKLIEAFRSVMGSYNSSYPYMHVFLQENFPTISGSKDDWGAEARGWAQRYYVAIRSIIQQGANEGTFRLPLSVGLITLGVLGTVNWAHRWYKPGGPLAAEDIGEGFADMILSGLAAKKRKR
ncbi:MAG: TetR/AcrR family transcriptional regulator [Pigmentiphaga sp.]